MNVIDFLTTDHRKVMDMIEQLEAARPEATGGPASGDDVFDELRDALKLHTRLEERVFYPALEDYHESRALIEKSYEDHRRVDGILARMDDLKNDRTGEWATQLAELKQSVTEHVREEETVLFPLATKLLNRNQLQDLYFEMERLRSGQSENDSLIYPARRVPEGE